MEALIAGVGSELVGTARLPPESGRLGRLDGLHVGKSHMRSTILDS